MGQTNCAIGISGMNPILDYAGTKDSFEKTLRITAIAIADETLLRCRTSDAKKQQTALLQLYVAMILKMNTASIHDLIRPQNEDLFR